MSRFTRPQVASASQTFRRSILDRYVPRLTLKMFDTKESCLVGIADETGTLKESEVFCQFQENDESPPKVVVNEVLVCRAPACESFRISEMATQC